RARVLGAVRPGIPPRPLSVEARGRADEPRLGRSVRRRGRARARGMARAGGLATAAACADRLGVRAGRRLAACAARRMSATAPLGGGDAWWLALDASTYAGTVAVLHGPVVVVDRAVAMRGEREERLMPRLVEALAE